MGRECFTLNTVMIKAIHQTQCPLHIAVILYFLGFSPFPPIFYCSIQGMRKGFSRISMIYAIVKLQYLFTNK